MGCWGAAVVFIIYDLRFTIYAVFCFSCVFGWREREPHAKGAKGAKELNHGWTQRGKAATQVGDW